MSFFTNVAPIDRIIRVILGIVFFVLAFAVFQDWLTWLFVVLGAVMLVTAAVGFCPLYRLFNFSTLPKQTEK